MNETYIYLKQATESIFSYCPIKTLVASIIALVCQKHFALFFGFVALVILDCFTRWLAISHAHLIEQGLENPSLWQSLKGLARARAAGKISSETMRNQGLSKLLVYIICVATAALSDKMLAAVNSQNWMVSLMVGYLIVTEALSVVENLSDAGVCNMSKLAEKIKLKI